MMALPGPGPTPGQSVRDYLLARMRPAEVDVVEDAIEALVADRLTEQRRRLTEEFAAKGVAAAPPVPVVAVAKEGCECAVCQRRRAGW